MPHILKLPEFFKEYNMPKVDIGRGWVESSFNTKRFLCFQAPRKLIFEPLGRDNLRRTTGYFFDEF